MRAQAAPPANVAPRALEVGDTVGVWQIEKTLGAGGFAVVYRARRADGTVGAVKVMHAKLAVEADLLARFDREIQVLRKLQHPNVVQFADAGLDATGRPYFAMELLEGHELGTLIRDRGPVAPPQAVAIIEALCGALSAAHDLGIVHRDVKASNVFVCAPAPGESLGRVVLLDFGIAKLSDALAPELTASHQSLGTPTSMAPEQIVGATVDGRTDLYALGCLLFQMLTGRVPFLDESPVMTQYLHLHARRPRASTVTGSPPAFDDVIVRAMALEPSARFPDARAMLAATRGALHRRSTAFTAMDPEQVAILVSVTDSNAGVAPDDAMLVDLESILPAAEHQLAALGFTLAVDLGSSALFVAAADQFAEVTAPALALWDHLAQRPRPHPRVVLGVCVHRGAAAPGGPLLRPASWRVEDPSAGLWISCAVEPSSPRGRRLR
jgi:serine/threonine-protein kinase